ncbi:MAG: hypothetical protein WCC23_17285 [Acinetobacter calcoaceticus]
MLICPLNSFLKKSLNDQVEAWLAQSTGRGILLTQKLDCAPSFISQIKNFTRPCSAENYKKIKEAMLEIEQDEKQ